MFNYWLLKLPNFAKSSRKWFDIRLVQCAINHKLITTCDFFLNSYRSPTFIYRTDHSDHQHLDNCTGFHDLKITSKTKVIDMEKNRRWESVASGLLHWLLLPVTHDKRMKFHFTANYKQLVTEVSSTPFSDCSPDSPGLP